MKKITKLLLLVAVAFAFTSGTAFAEVDRWSTCTPSQIGPKGNIVRVQLTGCNQAPEFTNPGNWMTLSTTGTDQMMATILTAMSLGKVVTVQTNGLKDADGIGIVDALILAM